MKRKINKQSVLAALLSVVLLMGAATGCTKKEETKPETKPEAATALVTKEVVVGDKTIKSEYIPFDEAVYAEDIYSGRIELIENSLWILLDGKLCEYSIGDSLSLVKEVELPAEEYEELSSDVKGNLYVNSPFNAMLTIKDGDIVATNDDIGNAVMDKNGTDGIAFSFAVTPKKVTISDNIASQSEWAFIDEEKVQKAGFTKNSMYVAGMDPEKWEMLVWIFDKKGNQKTVLGDVESSQDGAISTVADVVETDSGFMVLDENDCRLILWKEDGTLIGEIWNEDLFEDGDFMFNTATMGDDDTVYVGLTDESSGEFFVYRLSGF